MREDFADDELKMTRDQRMQQMMEESFDNIEEDGYYSYSDEDVETDNETEEMYAVDNDNKNTDSETNDFDELSITEKDWAKAGLNKEYKGTFNNNIALNMFYDNSSDLEKNQFEAIKYASYFARRGNNEAKNFVISIIQHPETCVSSEVSNLAKTSFVLFFRNYVRTETGSFYSRQVLESHDKNDRFQDAMQECMAEIFANINVYDPKKSGAPTTYFKRVILGALNNYEAKRKGRVSKGTLPIDAKVSKMETKLKNEGKNANANMIAYYLNVSVTQVLESQARIRGENTAISADSESGKYAAGIVKQNIYNTPEKNAIAKEKKEELLKLLDVLTDEEKKVLLATEGIELVEDEFIESEGEDSDTLHRIATRLGLDANKVKEIRNTAIQKIRTAQGVESKTDRLLSGRSIIFSKDHRDEDVAEFLDDITAIFDLEKWSEDKKYDYKIGDQITDSNGVTYTCIKNTDERNELKDEDVSISNNRFWSIKEN